MPTPKPKYTYYWHIHHDILCEGTYDINERIAYIKEYKPKNEIRTRLRLMTPVQHPEKLIMRIQKAAAVYAKAAARADTIALATYIKAYEAYQNTSTDADKSYATYKKASAAADKASAKAAKAYNTYMNALNNPQIRALHKKEHPNCPWNGKTIFPKRQ